MDVVYLPDFEEQFVIKPTVGLGKADIETRLRNGWAAEVFSMKVDNSNVVPYVINQIEKASEAAGDIFTTWAPLAAGVPPGAVPMVKKVLKAGALQAGQEDTKRAVTALGNLLLFKVVEVRIAQPGLYPILKPREIQQWFKTSVVYKGTDPEQTFELFLQEKNLPWIRPDMAFVPAPPFTMIGFNITTDLFFLPAGERVDLSVGDNPSDTTSQDDKVAQDIAASLRKELNERELHGGPQSSWVTPPRAPNDKWIIRIEHKKDEIPSPYIEADRDNIHNLISRRVQSKGIAPDKYEIHLPLAQSQLDRFKDEINAELSSHDAGNRWVVSKLEVEKQGSHKYAYEKTGNPETTITEDALEKLLRTKFDEFNVKNGAGKRTLSKS